MNVPGGRSYVAVLDSCADILGTTYPSCETRPNTLVIVTSGQRAVEDSVAECREHARWASPRPRLALVYRTDVVSATAKRSGLRADAVCGRWASAITVAIAARRTAPAPVSSARCMALTKAL